MLGGTVFCARDGSCGRVFGEEFPDAVIRFHMAVNNSRRPCRYRDHVTVTDALCYIAMKNRRHGYDSHQFYVAKSYSRADAEPTEKTRSDSPSQVSYVSYQHPKLGVIVRDEPRLACCRQGCDVDPRRRAD